MPIEDKDTPVEEVVNTSLAWNEPELPSIDDFAKQYNKYDHCIVTVYQIIRDLHLKQEVVDITVVDASIYDQNVYFIEATTRATGKLRLMAPFHLDAEIDLPWLRDLALQVSVCLSLGDDYSMGLGCNWTLSDSLQSPGLALPSTLISVPYHVFIILTMTLTSFYDMQCDTKEEELYLCIHTPESIIYELISTELP